MRAQISKRSSTKAERVFHEILKRNKVKFEFRKKIEGREIDFIIGKYAIEIDGHEQSVEKNQWLVKLGYSPLHYTNRLILTQPAYVENLIMQHVRNNL